MEIALEIERNSSFIKQGTYRSNNTQPLLNDPFDKLTLEDIE
jgi:hypothetical protein